MGASLTISNIRKTYDSGMVAVDSVSLDVAAGEFVSLLGASGSGKTTTLMMVAGFTAPDSGEILLNGQPIRHLPPEKRGLGVVFQNYALFPHMSVKQNVGFPLRMRGITGSAAAAKVDSAMDRVGLAGLGDRLPSQLSGGQQQRVALARALVFEPGVLLMDEPLGALDRSLRETMKAEIRRLHRQLGITILYVTHDQEEALTLSDRIALMSGGRISQIGSAQDIYEAPQNSFVASFIGEGTLLPGVVSEDASGAMALRIGDALPPLPGQANPNLRPGDRATLLLRPEKVGFAAADGDEGFAAVVKDISYVGDISRYTVELEGGFQINVKTPNRSALYRPSLGEKTRIIWARQDAAMIPQD